MAVTEYTNGVPILGQDPNTFSTNNQDYVNYVTGSLVPEINSTAVAMTTSETNAAVSETNAAVSETNAAVSETNASVSEVNAAASALSAANSAGSAAADFTGTSTTSTTISTGSKVFIIETGKAFVVGQSIQIVSDADVNNNMSGVITAHDPVTGSLTIDVDFVSGSGTFSDWVISFSTASGGLTPLESSITVTVGVGGDFADLATAVDYLLATYRYAARGTGGTVDATINILSGTVIDKPLYVEGVNAGWITITATDSTVTVDRASVRALSTYLFTFNSCQAPVINFSLQVDGSGASTLNIANYSDSTGSIGGNKTLGGLSQAFRTVNTGLSLTRSEIRCLGNLTIENVDNVAVYSSLGSTISGSSGITINNSSTYPISLSDSEIKVIGNIVTTGSSLTSPGLMSLTRSQIDCSTLTLDVPLSMSKGCKVVCNSVNCTLTVNNNNTKIVNLVDGAELYASTNISVSDSSGATGTIAVSAQDGCRISCGNSATLRDWGLRGVSCMNSEVRFNVCDFRSDGVNTSVNDLYVTEGSIARIDNTTNVGTNIAINTLTSNGIIFT